MKASGLSMASDQVTVLITCYREGDLLNRAMDSLWHQTDRDFSVVIVNDASGCPVTNRICSDASDNPAIRVIWRQRNGGLSAARNEGFKAIGGGIVMPLDGDDELPPTTVANARSRFRTDPECNFVFGDYVIIRDEVEKEVVSCADLADLSGKLQAQRLLSGWKLMGHSPCRWELWHRIGGYRQLFSYGSQDVDFWMRALACGAIGSYLNTSVYRWHRSSVGMNASVRPSRRMLLRAMNVPFMNLAYGHKRWRRDFMWAFRQLCVDCDSRRDARRALRYLLPCSVDEIGPYLRFAWCACRGMPF